MIIIVFHVFLFLFNKIKINTFIKNYPQLHNPFIATHAKIWSLVISVIGSVKIFEDLPSNLVFEVNYVHSSPPTTAIVNVEFKRLEMISFPPGIIALMVMGILCAVLGIIYAYLYYTRINPKSRRVRRRTEPPQPEEDSLVPPPSSSTHIFLFRKV